MCVGSSPAAYRFQSLPHIRFKTRRSFVSCLKLSAFVTTILTITPQLVFWSLNIKVGVKPPLQISRLVDVNTVWGDAVRSVCCHVSVSPGGFESGRSRSGRSPSFLLFNTSSFAPASLFCSESQKVPLLSAPVSSNYAAHEHNKQKLSGGRGVQTLQKQNQSANDL